jgi:splicing factor 3B subunit 3
MQAGVWQVLDGDMLGQFLELTNVQQKMILAEDNPRDSLETKFLTASGKKFPLEQVLGLFERIHNYLA